MHSLLTSLILIGSVLFGTADSFAYTEVGQTVQLSVQPSVSVTKLSANETGSINAENGSHQGLSASFLLQTNGTDADCDYIILSKASSSDEGEVSAFGENGSLIFTNLSNLPTNSQINNAKLGILGNSNVIAYPFEVDITSPMTVSYTKHSKIGDCYQILVNAASEGTITQTVKGTPAVNTYELGKDETGTYQAIVYITTISK